MLTLRFAEHVARLTRLPLADALCRFTPLYLSFGLARDFDPLHPVWRAFVAGLTPGRDLMDWTHAFYLRRQADVAVTDADVSPTFGCFSYVLWPGDRIRIHFRNRELPDRSPLGHERMPRRLAELSAMFKHLTTVVPPTATVVGGSWLYNVEAYRRLFPPRFLATARIGDAEYGFLALWGQFLDRYGRVRPTTARIFLEGLGRNLTEASLPQCFPYQVLRLEWSVLAFYEFYGIV